MEEHRGVQIVSENEEESGPGLEPPHIKEEPELCIKQEEDQLQEFLLTPVCVKTEDDEDKSSVLHQRPTEENREETNGEDCGAEAGCSSDPLTQLHSDSEEHTDSSSDTDHSEDYSQEQAPAKRSYAMISPDSSVTDVGGTHRPYSCSDCGKGFPRRGLLQNHELIHSGQRPFKCPFCVKGFTQKSNLGRHMRLHTGEKPFCCSVCEKSFADTCSLELHIRSHTGEKPYGCPVCNKGFSQKSNLSKHLQTHTGLKPYSCPVCEKNFTRKANVRQHMKSHAKQTTARGGDWV